MKRKLFKPELLIPTEQKGDTTSYEGFTYYHEEGTPNYIFTDTLFFKGFSRGRSSVKAHFSNFKETVEYEMFLSDFEDIVKQERLEGISITGEFTFRKQGQNFGLALLED